MSELLDLPRNTSAQNPAAWIDCFAALFMGYGTRNTDASREFMGSIAEFSIEASAAFYKHKERLAGMAGMVCAPRHEDTARIAYNLEKFTPAKVVQFESMRLPNLSIPKRGFAIIPNSHPCAQTTAAAEYVGMRILDVIGKARVNQSAVLFLAGPLDWVRKLPPTFQREFLEELGRLSFFYHVNNKGGA